jgi:DNA-binding transcriptional LysR family regulator
MTSVVTSDNFLESMDLYRLRSVVVLAEQLHFGRAARVLGVSQPALSKQLAQIEEELEGPLFLRGRAGVELTPAGRLVVGEARPLLAAADQLVVRARRSARGESGLLRLGFGFTTATLVAKAVVDLRQLCPDVTVELEDMSTPQQIAALDAGAIDLGFIRLPAPERFAVLPVLDDELILISPRTRAPWSKGIRGWRQAPFVLVPRPASPTFHDHVMQVCGALGFRPRVQQEARDFPTILSLVESHFGLSILPASAMARLKGKVTRTRLKTPVARWQVGAVWRRDGRNALLDRFRRLLPREALRPSGNRTAGLPARAAVTA